MAQPLAPKTPDLPFRFLGFICGLVWAVGGVFRGVGAVWGLGLKYGGRWVGIGRGLGLEVRSFPLNFHCSSTL